MCESLSINTGYKNAVCCPYVDSNKFIGEILPLKFPLEVILGSFPVKIMYNLTKNSRQPYTYTNHYHNT